MTWCQQFELLRCRARRSSRSARLRVLDGVRRSASHIQPWLGAAPKVPPRCASSSPAPVQRPYSRSRGRRGRRTVSPTRRCAVVGEQVGSPGASGRDAGLGGRPRRALPARAWPGAPPTRGGHGRPAEGPARRGARPRRAEGAGMRTPGPPLALAGRRRASSPGSKFVSIWSPPSSRQFTQTFPHGRGATFERSFRVAADPVPLALPVGTVRYRLSRADIQTTAARRTSCRAEPL